MRILVIEGSPHRNGSSNFIASRFIEGAEEAGHTVEVFDAGHADIHPCMGCDRCHVSGSCRFDDDSKELNRMLLDCDMVVFVTPIYYFGMSAQVKAAIDRFYSVNSSIGSKKAALITAAYDSGDEVMGATVSHYRAICRYLGFDDLGMVLGHGCGTVGMTESSRYPQDAYNFGRGI